MAPSGCPSLGQEVMVGGQLELPALSCPVGGHWLQQVSQVLVQDLGEGEPCPQQWRRCLTRTTAPGLSLSHAPYLSDNSDVSPSNYPALCEAPQLQERNRPSVSVSPPTHFHLVLTI